MYLKKMIDEEGQVHWLFFSDPSSNKPMMMMNDRQAETFVDQYLMEQKADAQEE
jgi:hypothetical protein